MTRTRIARAARLSRAGGRVLYLSAKTEAMLRVLGVRETARRLGAPVDIDTSSPGAASQPTPRGKGVEVRVATLFFRSLPGGPHCLRHALVLGALLREHKPRLRLGVRRQGGEFEAHAWLELDRQPLDVPGLAPEGRFGPLTHGL